MSDIKFDEKLSNVEMIEEQMKVGKVDSHAYQGDETNPRGERTAAEKRLLLKTDLCIMPLASLMFLVAYLDRNNVGNARLMGWQQAAHFDGQGYNTIASLFFVGYLLFMFPANTLIRFIAPQRMFGGAVIMFGVLCVCLSEAKSYGAVITIRIFIGIFQAAILATSLYIVYWYKRDEVATRGAIYYSSATLSGAFSGLIAYGIQKNLDGALGRSNWQWLFIIEGCLGILVGILVLVLLPPFPDQIKDNKHWLFSPEEIELAKIRALSYHSLDAKIDMKQIWATFKDPKTWLFTLPDTSIALAISSVGLFLPTFINSFGYSPLKSQLFSVIPYACAFVTLLLVNIISDRLNIKFIPLICCMTVSLIGYIILITVNSIPVKVFAACLVVSGSYPSVTLIVIWLGINSAGFSKRSATWSIAEVCANALAIMGSHVYIDPPKFIEGHSIVIAFQCLGMIAATINYFYMKSLNKKRDIIEEEYRQRGEMHPHYGRSLEEEYDFHVSFRYTL